MRFVLAAAILALLTAPAPRESTTLIPWAWERHEDLRFLDNGQPVAWYAGILTLDGDRVIVEPRRNPLRLPMRAHRVAVIRIETKNPKLDAAQRARTASAILHLFRHAEELQLDFDARTSERAFYRRLLEELRPQINARLSITALTSWCYGDRWLRDLPIDEAVPMFFRMGRDAPAMHRRLARGETIPEPRCRASAGISLDEPLPRIPRVARVWIFNPERWTEETWKTAQLRAAP